MAYKTKQDDWMEVESKFNDNLQAAGFFFGYKRYVDILSFGKINGLLTDNDCLEMHQIKNGYVAPSLSLRKKVMEISDKIKTTQWERPEQVYEDDRILRIVTNKNQIK